jgi:hypothetical protein
MTTTVREAMGTHQLIFIQINDLNTHFRFTHHNKWFAFHKSWSPFKQYFRGRKFAAVLTKEMPAKSKSGSTFVVLGVLAVFDTVESLSVANKQYWTMLDLKKSDKAKLEGTYNFALGLKDQFEDEDKGSNFYSSTLKIIDKLVPSITITTDSTLTF